MTEYKLPYIFSSDPNQGASNVSVTGDRFSVFFDRPIIVPEHAINVHIVVQEASIWNVVPNIIEGENNILYITHFDGVVSTPYVVNIPTGLYGLHDLDSAINRELVNLGAPTNLITLAGDSSTQKTVIQINVLPLETISIDFTPSDTFRDILGFNSQVIPPTSGPINIFSDNTANFNNIEYFLVSSSLISKGISLNNNYNSVIAQILIDKPSGQQIISTPFNPPEIPANELIGTRHNKIDFWVTDQASNPINLLNEIFSIRLIITYTIPHWARKEKK